MEKSDSATSKKTTKSPWFKPDEVWGGDTHDNPEIGDTFGLRVKRWCRGLPDHDEQQDTLGSMVGSKITLRKLVIVVIATLVVHCLMYLALPCAGMRTKVIMIVQTRQLSYHANILRSSDFQASHLPLASPVYVTKLRPVQHQPLTLPSPPTIAHQNSSDIFNEY